jgi:UDP-N-acetylglucosamine diphosphorylase/glucosamine-1-phosphate N-acetyltransferase
MIDAGAQVNAFSRLEGPCYIGKESWIVGAKLRANSTIGPCCRIGGEVEASLVQGHSNKYHEGFLGHSYVGEWVNLAAATQTSDLRNDYDVVRMTVNGQRLNTGKTKVGSFIGDHTKTGLGALFNTGSAIGAFANVLPSGTLLPQVIPSFCLVQHGQLQEQWDLRKLFHTAGRAMQRRGKELTEVHRDFYYGLFDATTSWRQRTIRDEEVRRMRKSV